MIEVKNLWKSFKGKVVNEDVSLFMRPGEIVALLGPNGGGKTTLLRQIYGEIRSDKGEVYIDGMRPFKALHLMGVVPQDSRPMFGLKSKEHVFMMGLLKGMKRDEVRRRASELLDKFQVEDKLVDDLSGGNKRKVLIASALMGDPKYLLLDEPTTGLDPRARREVWDMLKSIKSVGKGILLTTHYLEEAEKLADRVYFLKKRILMEGDTQELRRRFTRFYTVTNVETGEEYRVREEELLSFLRNFDSGVEVRLASLEEIYSEVVGNE